MEELEIITLEEDGQDYIVIDEIKDNGVTYVYLSNMKKKSNVCIRKVIVEDGEEFIDGLDSDKEYDRALLLFSEKHKKDNLN